MPNVILKDENGVGQPYPNVDTVLLNTEDGGTAAYVSEHLIQNQIQADWNQTDDTQPDYIKNKPESFESEPELPEIVDGDDGKVLGIANGIWQKITISNSGGSGSGGSSVQPDWNQNDSTAADYIKNRPFYDNGTKMTYIFPKSELTFTENPSVGGPAYVVPDTDGSMTTLWRQDWTEINVEWGDNTFTCQAQEVMGVKCIGNIEAFLGSGNSGHPFVIAVDDCGVFSSDMTILIVAALDGSSSCEVAIGFEEPDIVKIPGKYLSLPNWNQNDSTAADYIQNRPFYDGGKVLKEFINGDISCTYEGNNVYIYFAMVTKELVDAWNHISGSVTVVWDGTTYTCEPSSLYGANIVGNIGLMMGGEDTGEPFILAFTSDADMNILLIYAFEDAIPDTSTGEEIPPVTHNVQVSAEVNDIHKLPLKYHWSPDWAESDETSGSYIKNKPFGDYLSGTVLYDGTLSLLGEDVDAEGNPAYIYAGSYKHIIVPSGTYITIGIDNYSTYQQAIAYADGYVTANEITYNGYSYQLLFGRGYVGVVGMTDSIIVMTTNPTPPKISLTLGEDVTVPIQSKYLPDDSGSLPEVTTSDNDKVLTVVGGVWSAKTPATGLPTVTTTNNGKVLKVVNGAWAASDETKELPTVTAINNDQVLKVVDGVWTASDAPTSLPDVTTNDAGKFLRVDSTGVWVVEAVRYAEEVSF